MKKIALKGFTKKAAECPHCGDPDAYVGITKVDCPSCTGIMNSEPTGDFGLYSDGGYESNEAMGTYRTKSEAEKAKQKYIDHKAQSTYYTDDEDPRFEGFLSEEHLRSYFDWDLKILTSEEAEKELLANASIMKTMKKANIARLIRLAMVLDQKGFTKEAQTLDQMFEGGVVPQGYAEKSLKDLAVDEDLETEYVGHDEPGHPWTWFIGEQEGRVATLQEATDKLQELGADITYEEAAKHIRATNTTEYVKETESGSVGVAR